uniref:Protein kinase domain-containing protein n=1 Tax=Panagrellus redivivus TaxID=6233 RepID=A0A7E4VDV3_PANRE
MADVPVEQTLNNLRDLFLDVQPTPSASSSSGLTASASSSSGAPFAAIPEHRNRIPSRTFAPPAPNSETLTIIARSSAERFRLTVQRPVSFKDLNDYIRRRHSGVPINIFHANNNLDFLQLIEDQEALEAALRLHDSRSKESKFRIFVSPKSANDVLGRPDKRGIYRGTNFDDVYSENGTSAFSTAATPDGKKLEEIFAANPQAPKPPTEWREATCIGQGAHGRVMLCVDRETGDQLVVKKIYARGDGHAMKARVQSLSEEVTILSRLKHDNIVRYLGVVVTDNCVNIFMEYMTAGSLYDEINKFGELSEKRAIRTTKQVLSGLEYLHSLNIVHRDIKSANILRHASPADYKLGDFGSAQYMRALASLQSAEYRGTPHYTAPEIVRDSQPYSNKADIWSVGITIVEMLTCKTPYSETPSNAVLFRIAEGPVKYELPPEISPALKALIDKMLSQAPKDRPETTEILAMDLLTTV